MVSPSLHSSQQLFWNICPSYRKWKHYIHYPGTRLTIHWISNFNHSHWKQSSLNIVLFNFIYRKNSITEFVKYIYHQFHNQLFLSSQIIFFLINLFIYLFWLHWVFIAVHGLSPVAASRGYSSLWCTGFSLLWLLWLQSMGSRCTGFSSCGTQASVVVARGL